MGWVFVESMITMHIHFYVLDTLMRTKQRTHGAYSYAVKDKGITSRHLTLDKIENSVSRFWNEKLI